MVFRISWVLIYLFFLHLVGIYLLTRGFLLSRLSLSAVASCSDSDSTVHGLHSVRAPAPVHAQTQPLPYHQLPPFLLRLSEPEPHPPYYHDVLTLPRDLAKDSIKLQLRCQTGPCVFCAKIASPLSLT